MVEKKWLEREQRRPEPIVTSEGAEEWEVQEIVDEQQWGRGVQLLQTLGLVYGLCSLCLMYALCFTHVYLMSVIYLHV